MTAVRPGSRTDDLGVPAMDARLAALLADADGALASVTAPMAAIDPIALFAAAVEADLEAALWLRPADGTALVGVGRAWATSFDGPDRFADAERAWRELLDTARARGREPGAHGRASGSRVAGRARPTCGPRSGRPRWCSRRSWWPARPRARR